MEIFPVNIAVGEVFCNRIDERKLLKQYINHGRHCVLIAPRRYGKMSLVNQSLIELKLPHAMMELTMATSVADVERMVITYVGRLLYSILPKTTKARQNLLKLFKWLNPELVLTVGGQKIVFHPERDQSDPLNNISEILKKLDSAATLVKKQVVVVMDEFQQLCDIEKDHTIEASIRRAMQYSKQVSYVFSGSNRHMLLSMFNSKNRPFYNSCEIMRLERISVEDYIRFIQHAAQKKWGKPLQSKVLDEIFKLTELHPSYINRICGYFWLINELPKVKSVQQYWYMFIDSKRAEFTEDVLKLSKNQKKILTALSKEPTAHPSHHKFANRVGLPEASIRQALRVLLLKDYVYKDKGNIYRVLDPAFRDFILGINI